MSFEKAIIVTRRTRLDEMITRFNTRAQARFYIEHAGGDFADYEIEHDTYAAAVARVRDELETSIRVQSVDRSLVPTFLFAETDLVVTVGQDGLVANVAKYAAGRPIVAVNPDPARYDGILLPFSVDEAAAAVRRVTSDSAVLRPVTMAEARLNDGQVLRAFNDLFLGVRSHVSARYRIAWGGAKESHSSSGIIVSTGAGSSGWLSSLFNMAEGVCGLAGETVELSRPELDWSTDRLVFVVREPFVSRHSSARIRAGVVDRERELVVESTMPGAGVIFSDGVESDFLHFNAGAIATIRFADSKALLVSR